MALASRVFSPELPRYSRRRLVHRQCLFHRQVKSPQTSTSKRGFPGAARGSGSPSEKVGHTASRLEIFDQAQKKAGVLLSSESLLGALSELDIRPGF